MLLQRQQRCVGVAIVVAALVILLVTLGVQCRAGYARHSIAERLEHFERQRDAIQMHERRQYLGGRVVLDDKETFVNGRIASEKLVDRDEEHAHWNSNASAVGDVYANWLFQFIQSRPLFKLLRSMPKGAALDVDGLSMVSTDYLIELSYQKDLWLCIRQRQANQINSNDSNNYKDTQEEFSALRFSRLQPAMDNESSCAWILLEELRVRESNGTVDERLRRRFERRTSESGNVLPQYEQFVEGLLSYEPVWVRYIYRSLEEFSKDNVQFVEIQTTLPTLYDLDGGNYTYLDTARLMQETVAAYCAQNGQFIGAMIIYETKRSELNEKDYDQYLERAVRLQHRFPTFMAGINLAKKGAPDKLVCYLSSQLFAVQDDLNFYYQPEGVVGQLSVEDGNLMSALLLGSKRVRLDLSLLRHPVLNRVLLRQQVGIGFDLSALLSSNRCTLQELQRHPVAYYFANGFPLVVASRFATHKALTPLTHDYYLTYVGVTTESANLGTLKQLAWNSIRFSSLDMARKEKLYRKWTDMWSKWIERAIDIEL